MKGHGQKLTARQEKLISALLTGPTYEAAAAAADVGETTLYRWLKQPLFKTAYEQARQGILERTITRLLAVSGKAVATLEANLDCDDPAARNRAAVAVLQHTLKGLETLARNGQPGADALLDLLYRGLPAHTNGANGAGGPQR